MCQVPAAPHNPNPGQPSAVPAHTRAHRRWRYGRQSKGNSKRPTMSCQTLPARATCCWTMSGARLATRCLSSCSSRPTRCSAVLPHSPAVRGTHACLPVRPQQQRQQRLLTRLASLEPECGPVPHGATSQACTPPLLRPWCSSIALLQVVIQYRSAGRLLQGAERVWAHAGHSGWQHTLDVELFRTQQDDGLWTGTYKIPASELAAPSHVEVQIVFKGQMAKGHIVWDNNEGNNWQVRRGLRASGCAPACVAPAAVCVCGPQDPAQQQQQSVQML